MFSSDLSGSLHWEARLRLLVVSRQSRTHVLFIGDEYKTEQKRPEKQGNKSENIRFREAELRFVRLGRRQ